MNWAHFGVALVAASVAISLSDWLFFGLLFHEKYLETPELWRASSSGKKIAWSMVIAVLGCAAFLLLCAWIGIHGYAAALGLAALVWASIALPIVLTSAIYLKYSPLFAFSHSAGYLARLAIAAVAYVLLMG
jgi:hypothetical protein